MVGTAIATATDTAGGIVDARMMTAEEEVVVAAAAAEVEAETTTMSQQALVRIVEEAHQDRGPRQQLHPLPCLHRPFLLVHPTVRTQTLSWQRHPSPTYHP